MRIIGGDLRRRTLHTPPDADRTRPMPDRVREALFNLLRGHTEDQAVLDAFAGTGAVGLEALSRGAARCVFVERDRQIARILQSNIDDLDVGDRAELVPGDALGPAALARCPRPVHLIFFDPPYPMLDDPATRHRVFGQFARFISLLDDEGYAVLRTRWPFRELPEKSAGAAAAGGVGGYGDIDDEDGKIFLDLADLDAEIARLQEDGDDDSDMDDETHAAAPPPPIQPPRPRDIPLEIEGAIGPETHAYGSMALHLYMRQR